jgi:hypothetical protein
MLSKIINKISIKIVRLLTSVNLYNFKLKREIEGTIKVYELACKPENLNYEYLAKNCLHFGICMYSKKTDKPLLHDYIIDLGIRNYITSTPQQVQTSFIVWGDFDYAEMKQRIKDAHEFRINFLKNKLKSL